MQNTELKNRLTKTLDFLKTELSQIRTGRASPSLLESIQLDAYQTRMTIMEVGSVSVKDPQTLLVSPWDKSLVSSVAKAIRESDLHLNPVVDNDLIIVPIPALTEERRKELAKVVSIKVEETKNSMRNIRQDAMKDIDKDFTDKTMGEDDKFSRKDEVEKLLKEFTSTADELGETKKQELMKV